MQFVAAIGLILSLILSSSLCFAAPKIEFISSKMQALVRFSWALAEFPHQAPALIEAFHRSPFRNQPEARRAIASLQSLRGSLAVGANFEQGIPGRQGGFTVETLITIQSIYAKDVDDLGRRISGLMPMASEKVLLSALKEIEPIFNDVIWNKSRVELERAREHLQNSISDKKISEAFSKIVKFYSAVWPKDHNFTVGVYPILFLENFRNSTTSQSLGPIEEHGIALDLRKPKLPDSGDIGVIYHEISHSIYAAQDKATMLSWKTFFDPRRGPYALQAHLWLNEALATAIGNGWIEEKLSGRLATQEWYNHPIIDKFSKAIYPDVKAYLENGRSLDQDLANRIIEAFQRNFPQSNRDLTAILNKVLIVADATMSDSSPTLLAEFRKSFSPSTIGMNRYTEIEGEDPFFPVIVLFNESTKASLLKSITDRSLLKKAVPLIHELKVNQVGNLVLASNVPVILIKLEDKAPPNWRSLWTSLAKLPFDSKVRPQTLILN